MVNTAEPLVIDPTPDPDDVVAGDAAVPEEIACGPLESQRIRRALRFSKVRSWLGTLRTFWGLQQGRWWEWLAIWVLQNVRYCPVYVLPLLTALLIDRIHDGTPADVYAVLPWVVLGTLAMCVTTVFSETGAKYLISRIARHLTASMRTAVLHQLNRVELSFHDRSRIGALQSKFTLDLGRLEGLQTFLCESVLLYGTVTIVMLGIIAWTNAWLLVALVVAVPIHVLLARGFWHVIDSLNSEYRGAESSFMAHLHQALSGVRTVRAHASEDFTEQRVARAAGTVARKAIRLDFMTNLFGSGSWAISTMLYMGVVAFGVWLAVGDDRVLALAGMELTIRSISLGEFTVLLSYYGIISGAVGSVLGGLPAVSAATDGIRSLATIYHHEQDRGGRGKRQILGRLRGEIQLTDVSFRYPDAPECCLDHLDLALHPGGSVALVGPSGSGKSTVASLILGFYPIEGGRITIDGVDLWSLDHRSLRRQVGVVSQDVVLFHASVLANIAWGDPKPDAGRVREAARRAQADGFISALSDGYDTVLGDGGSGLSGGQRQRLAIARALYRDPRLLILDEATSALDPESERSVAEAIDELRRDRTTLIIAHRLSTVRKVDRIAVIDGGRVVEQGTFAELMARKGAFYHLAEGQLVDAPASTGDTVAEAAS